MGIARMIRRAAPLIVVGVAGAAAARRRSERLRQARLAPPPYPPPTAEAGPVVDVEPEPVGEPETSDVRRQTSGAEPEPEPAAESEPEPAPEPEPEPEPEVPADEQPTAETTAIEHAPWLEPEPDPEPEETTEPDSASVTEIVDDLLAPEREDSIEDATVVEEPPDDARLAETARAALSEEPGLPGGVSVEVEGGAVVLSGEVERAATIAELERRAAEVPGIRSVSSFLHLPGTPPPGAREHR